ncbi:MAG: endopeptidase La [Lachnospiraceae bacterium]|nr:endopeptidase La [Lachnospiraceae bacterium]
MIVLPIYNVIALPDTTIYYKGERYVKFTGREPVLGEEITLMVSKTDIDRVYPKADDFYPIGLRGIIREIGNNGYIAIDIKERVNIEEVKLDPEEHYRAKVSKRGEIEDLDPESVAGRLKAIKAEIIRASEGYEWSSLMRTYIVQWNTIEELAGVYSLWMVNANDEKYMTLTIDSKKERFDLLEKMLYESLEITKVKNQASTAQEQDYKKLYRESAIKKQMEYLQKELDDMHPENLSDIRSFEIKLQKSEMNEEARKEGEKVLNRLKSEGQHSAETGMLMDYLDLLTSLPWKKEPAERISLEEAEKVLNRDHAGLKKVKKRIIEQIAVMNLKGSQNGSILLFVGAPGTGKTSIGQSIADALLRKYVRISLGGVRDEADIRGHRRTYIGSMPGRIIDGINKCGVSNPVMVLDEVDKLSQSYNGDPASALLEVLDPEQNVNFTDHYLNVPYDLSDVLFICTANTVETIPEPLLNRMEVIEFRGYTPIEKVEIAKKHLLPKSMESVGLNKKQLSITVKAIDKIIGEYTRESGVRGLKKRIDSICRGAAVRISKDPETKVSVNDKNLEDILDMNPVHQKRVKRSAEPGIVTGLAWTQAGGDILYIETMFIKGEGKIIITGQLGDVMKESAQIAVSLVKSFFPDKADMFKENDLHIHVPDGATPKDGPSAGITLTTALASLVRGKSLPPNIAMTGEVSLQGTVNPIGGLMEKLMAAHRAGVKKVFIPEENLMDLKDVATEVKDNIEIVTVKKVKELLKELQIL